MSSDVTIFKKGHKGGIFAGKLLREDGTPRDLTGYTALEVIFIKPNGKTIIKPAVPDNPGNLADSNIMWTNNTPPSILDKPGVWEFQVAAHFGASAYVPSYQSVVFWVVK